MVGALAAVHQQPAAAASKAAISTGEAAAFADSLSDLERQFKKRGMGVNEKAILVHCLDSLLQVLNPPSAPKDLEASDLTECVADIFAATAAETNPPEVVVQVSDCFRTASGDFTILISDGKYSTIVRPPPHLWTHCAACVQRHSCCADATAVYASGCAGQRGVAHRVRLC